MEISFNVMDDECEYGKDKLVVSLSDSHDVEFSMGGNTLFIFPMDLKEELIAAINMVESVSLKEQEDIRKYLAGG
jgi:hypothetical protein